MCERLDLPDFIMDFTSLMPNKSPEPTPVTPLGLPRRFPSCRVPVPAWLSFLR